MYWWRIWGRKRAVLLCELKFATEISGERALFFETTLESALLRRGMKSCLQFCSISADIISHMAQFKRQYFSPLDNGHGNALQGLAAVAFVSIVIY